MNPFTCSKKEVSIIYYIVSNITIIAFILKPIVVPLEIIQQPPQEIGAKIHQTVELSFVVTGFPKPLFQWYLNNLKMESATANPLVITDFRFFLYLKENFNPLNSGYLNNRNCDVGSYTCEITQQCRNGHVQTISTAASQVSLEAFAPYVTQHPRGCELKPGDFAEMRCVVEGHPIPDLQWYKDDKLLRSETRPILKVNRLMYIHQKS